MMIGRLVFFGVALCMVLAAGAACSSKEPSAPIADAAVEPGDGSEPPTDAGSCVPKGGACNAVDLKCCKGFCVAEATDSGQLAVDASGFTCLY